MPVDRGVVEQQLRELGQGAGLWGTRELRDLPAVLDGGERILAVGRGRVARGRWLRRPWLIVVTDRRLLCIRSERPAGWRQIDVPADVISRATLRAGPFKGRILVVADGRKHRLLVSRADARDIIGALALLDAPANQVPSGFAPARMLRQVVDHMMALPAVALEPGRRTLPGPTPTPGLSESDSTRIDLLEDQVRQLQQQVDFLEQVLRQRQEGS